MTIAVDLGRKATKQTKQMYRICQVTSAKVFWHYTLLGSVILTFSTFITGTVFIIISGFQIIAELK